MRICISHRHRLSSFTTNWCVAVCFDNERIRLHLWCDSRNNSHTSTWIIKRFEDDFYLLYWFFLPSWAAVKWHHVLMKVLTVSFIFASWVVFTGRLQVKINRTDHLQSILTCDADRNNGPELQDDWWNNTLFQHARVSHSTISVVS